MKERWISNTCTTFNRPLKKFNRHLHVNISKIISNKDHISFWVDIQPIKHPPTAWSLQEIHLWLIQPYNHFMTTDLLVSSLPLSFLCYSLTERDKFSDGISVTRKLIGVSRNTMGASRHHLPWPTVREYTLNNIEGFKSIQLYYKANTEDDSNNKPDWKPKEKSQHES